MASYTYTFSEFQKPIINLVTALNKGKKSSSLILGNTPVGTIEFVDQNVGPKTTNMLMAYASQSLTVEPRLVAFLGDLRTFEPKLNSALIAVEESVGQHGGVLPGVDQTLALHLRTITLNPLHV